MPYYPNECFVCHTTGTLKRCGRCNMISYCGEIHQKEHWRYHKDICKVISELMKERGVSHLYENLCNIDPKRWKAEREQTRQAVESRLMRSSIVEEVEMFRYPRVCFVCHSAKQDTLRNCPGCPLASFCQNHPSSSLHDKDCPIIKKAHSFESEIDPRSGLITKVVSKIVTNTPRTIPTSMQEFIDNSLRRGETLPACMQFYLAEHLSIPLSIFNAFQKLKDTNKTEESIPKMVFHIRGISRRYAFTNSWESLLHLMPSLNNLTVVITDQSENSRMEASLCNRCTSKKKKLLIEGIGMHYLKYLKTDYYKKPNIVTVYNAAPPEDDDEEREVVWKIEMGVWNQLSCPLVLTTTSEKKATLTSESLRSTFWSSRICYEGVNDFAPLNSIREWEGWSVCKNYEYMVVVKAPENNIKGPARGSFSFAKAMRDFHEPTRKPSKEYFWASLCRLCRANSTSVTCKGCKMIFYCSETHQREDLPQHRDFCKIISGMIQESGATTIFDNLKNADSELWLRAKVYFMKKAKNIIERELQGFEKEMFLFPKTCFVCHETDFNLLRNCDCGIILCKAHKDHSKHKEICCDYSSAIKLKMIEKSPSVQGFVRSELFDKTNDNLPASIESFLNIYLKVSDCSQFGIPNFHKILISDALSLPLTALYALQKLNLSKKKLKIHILGAIHSEIVEEGLWIMLNWLTGLKKLELTFFNTDISTLPIKYTTDLLFPDLSFFGEKGFVVSAHSIRYDHYCKLGSVEKPHIILGYNLNIHEIDYGISEYNWKDIILAVKKMNVPFVMTSGSEEKAKRDHRKLCSFLGEKVEFSTCEENPFASLFPERDFELEGLCYRNKFITIYPELVKKAVNKSAISNFESIKRTTDIITPITYVKHQADSKNLEQEVAKIESSKLRVELETGKSDNKFECGRVKNCEVKIESPILGINTPEETVETPKIELQNAENESKILHEKKEFKIEHIAGNESKVENEKKEFRAKSIAGNESKVANEKKEFKTEYIDNNESKIVNEKKECKTESIAENESEAVNEKKRSKTESIVDKVSEIINEEKGFKSESLRSNEELLKENSLLKNINRLLMENTRLKEENEKIRNENLKLKENSARLKAENQSIKDVRQQVQENIQLAMNDEK